MGEDGGPRDFEDAANLNQFVGNLSADFGVLGVDVEMGGLRVVPAGLDGL